MKLSLAFGPATLPKHRRLPQFAPSHDGMWGASAPIYPLVVSQRNENSIVPADLARNDHEGNGDSIAHRRQSPAILWHVF